MEKTIFKSVIPLTPVSKKNSQRIVLIGGKPRILPSAKYKQYERDCMPYIKYTGEPINGAVNVKCVYYMPTKRRCDVVNMLEATLDILVKYGVLADDNSNIVVSMDGSRVLYDKENSRTEVEITPIEC
jgi:Holliday junction resolvase RusA-like endonuclease